MLFPLEDHRVRGQTLGLLNRGPLLGICTLLKPCASPQWKKIWRNSSHQKVPHPFSTRRRYIINWNALWYWAKVLPFLWVKHSTVIYTRVNIIIFLILFFFFILQWNSFVVIFLIIMLLFFLIVILIYFHAANLELKLHFNHSHFLLEKLNVDYSNTGSVTAIIYPFSPLPCSPPPQV